MLTKLLKNLNCKKAVLLPRHPEETRLFLCHREETIGRRHDPDSEGQGPREGLDSSVVSLLLNDEQGRRSF